MRLIHFITLTGLAVVLVAAMAIIATSPLAFLNSDSTLTGVLLNLTSVSASLALLGFVLTFALRIVSKNKVVSPAQTFWNSLVLSVAVLSWYYGASALLFNWPINLERTTPDYFENRGSPLLLGLVLLLFACISWVAWALWSVRNQASFQTSPSHED